MAEGIHRHNLLFVAPLREGSDVGGGLGVGEVRAVVDGEVVDGDGEGMVNAVASSMGAEGWNC